jgi:hypothetical protein
MERAASARSDKASQRRNVVRAIELSPGVHANSSQLAPSGVTDDIVHKRKHTLLRHWSKRLALVTLAVGALVTPLRVHAETEQAPAATATATALLAQHAQLGAAISALKSLAMASPPEGISDEQVELYTQVMADIASFVDESAAACAPLNDELQGLDEANQEQLERLGEQLGFQSEGVKLAMDRVAKWLQASGRSLRKVAENIQKILDLLQ